MRNGQFCRRGETLCVIDQLKPVHSEHNANLGRNNDDLLRPSFALRRSCCVLENRVFGFLAVYSFSSKDNVSGNQSGIQ